MGVEVRAGGFECMSVHSAYKACFCSSLELPHLRGYNIPFFRNQRVYPRIVICSHPYLKLYFSYWHGGNRMIIKI